MTGRRAIIGALIVGLATAPLVWRFAAAQQGGRVRRIAILFGLAESDPEGAPRMAALRQGLRDRGWVEGQNLALEARWGAGDAAVMKTLAVELANQHPDLILVQSNPGISAVGEATRTIPIVFVQVADPVGGGFIQSLSRPGGNITGLTNFESSMGGKWVEALKELAPSMRRVAVLYHPETAAHLAFRRSAGAAAAALAVEPTWYAVHDAMEVEKAFAAFGGTPDTGVIPLPHIVTEGNKGLIRDLAMGYRLPNVTPFRHHAHEGALFAYGIDVLEIFRECATYIDKILKGAKPAELPVQAPNKFTMVVNLKTARAMGFAVPPALLARADEVIE
jgi:putative tryptophan/tyrosine transport system substrate-binding protein